MNAVTAADCTSRPPRPRGAARTIIATPGASALLASSIIARLPLAMFSIALLVHAQRLTGSFAVAGVVSGAYVIARGVSSPLLGRLVDRHGQTIVLVASASSSALLLMTAALLPAGVSSLVLVALAAAVGLASPPLAACARTLLPAIVREPAALPGAYALEATALELTFIVGPPLALTLGALWSTGAALAASGLILLAATVAFAFQPASRSWRQASRARGGSLRSPAIQTLVMVLIAVGAVFGAVDVGVTAAMKTLGGTVAAGPLLGLWGVGSLFGGIVATRLSGSAGGAGGLTVLLAALALGHGALALTSGSALAIGAVLVLAGASIAPMSATIYAMAGSAAPPGTATEAFGWLLTATSTGASIGAALAGALAQSAGAPVVFVFAGAAGVLAVVIALVRGHTLCGDCPNRLALAAQG